MKKNLPLVIILGIVSLLSVNIFFLIQKPPVKITEVPSGQIGLPGFADNQDGLLVFPTVSDANKTVTTRDFRKDADVEVIDDVTYQIDEGSIGEDLTYQIYFDDVDKNITISLLKEPLQSSRLSAEVALVKRLEVNKNDLCSMNITVNTPAFVNEKYSGNNLGLSFCPGAVSL